MICYGQINNKKCSLIKTGKRLQESILHKQSKVKNAQDKDMKMVQNRNIIVKNIQKYRK